MAYDDALAQAMRTTQGNRPGLSENRYKFRTARTRSRDSSTNGRERHCSLKHQLTDLASVLQRPVEGIL